MKPQLILLAIVAITLCSCDGHVRSFKPLPSPERTGTATAAAKQKLVDGITEVATQRGYTLVEPTSESRSYTVIASFQKSIDRDSVVLRLIQDMETGAHEIVILDWPSFTRSTESRAVEAAIRARLNERENPGQ